MAGNFDPYYKWLGIPPKDQPPNFYRLLGIDLYEADPEVIAIAAEQRIWHVRSFQNGEYALISKSCKKRSLPSREYLLDAEKKAEYDASLKLQLQHQQPQSLPVAQPFPIRQSPPQVAQPPPVQDTNTDYSINPIVIIKETLDWLRHHRKVTSTVVKLFACNGWNRHFTDCFSQRQKPFGFYRR